jgi:hypothetical protein
MNLVWCVGPATRKGEQQCQGSWLQVGTKNVAFWDSRSFGAVLRLWPLLLKPGAPARTSVVPLSLLGAGIRMPLFLVALVCLMLHVRS